MKVFIVLVLCVVADTGLAAYDCSGVKDADCAAYNLKVVPHNPVEYGECRFKLIDGKTSNRQGLEISSYAEQTVEMSKVPLNTYKCPRNTRILMTESPTAIGGYGYFPGDQDYRQCCVKKVLDKCFYQVVADLNCRSYVQDDDEIQRVEVLYENPALNKRVTVVFDPKYKKVECVNSFDGKPKRVLYKTDGNESGKYCGDNDINVRIEREVNPKTNAITLEVNRFECNSQYVKMFDDEEGRTKFTIRTEVNQKKRSDAIGGTEIAPVLAQTKKGACQNIVSYVTYTPPE